MCWEWRERFSHHPDIHHGTCVRHMPWCMPGSLTSGFLWSQGPGIRSRHSRRMRNPHFFTYLVRGPCNEGCKNYLLQLPSTVTEYDIQATEDQTDSLRGRRREYHTMQTEDIKSRLKQLLDNISFGMKIEQGSIDQLHQLVHNYSACLQTLEDEAQVLIDYDEKFWQLQDIEARLRALQSTEDQTTLLQVMYIEFLKDILRDLKGDDIQAVMYRLKMMHEKNDSVWLLCDGLDWLLPEVQSILLHQTSGDSTIQCPGNEQEREQLLHGFIGRLHDWRESLDKQQRLHSNLSMMVRCWPEYPWVSFNFKLARIWDEG